MFFIPSNDGNGGVDDTDGDVDTSSNDDDDVEVHKYVEDNRTRSNKDNALAIDLSAAI